MSLCLREHALEVKLHKYFHFAEKREKQRLILAAKSVGSHLFKAERGTHISTREALNRI